jgi:hypothetical protein
MATQTASINPVNPSSVGLLNGPASFGLSTGDDKPDFGWSGVVVRSAGSGITSVSGQWTVPSFTPSASGPSNCLIWVGIDGKYGSDDVVQAGVGCDFNGGAPDIYAWFEWAPDPLQKLLPSDLPVLAGDVIYCSVAGQISSDTVTIEIRNLRPGAVPNAYSKSFTSKSGKSLTGNCAEWIVEALRIDGNPTILCNYGQVQFSGCAAADDNGNPFDPYYRPVATAYKLLQYGQVVSYGSSTASGQVTCSQDQTVGGSVAVPNAIPGRALPAPNAITSRAIGSSMS